MDWGGEKFKDGKGGVFIFDGMFYIGSDGVYSKHRGKSTPTFELSIHSNRLKAKGVTDDEINELINEHEKQEFKWPPQHRLKPNTTTLVKNLRDENSNNNYNA